MEIQREDLLEPPPPRVHWRTVLVQNNPSPEQSCLRLVARRGIR
jgi:hypothetical protein